MFLCWMVPNKLIWFEGTASASPQRWARVRSGPPASSCRAGARCFGTPARRRHAPAAPIHHAATTCAAPPPSRWTNWATTNGGRTARRESYSAWTASPNTTSAVDVLPSTAGSRLRSSSTPTNRRNAATKRLVELLTAGGRRGCSTSTNSDLVYHTNDESIRFVGATALWGTKLC